TDEEIHRAAVETAVDFVGGTDIRATLALEGVDVATAGECAGSARETFPLVVLGAPRGSLPPATSTAIAPESHAAVGTLAAQVALALETVARAREKADAERRRVHGLFSRFVPEAVVDEVLAQADGARLGGRAIEGTIMFTDLRGFTTFSESR